MTDTSTVPSMDHDPSIPHPFDGSPEEFPHRDWAMEQYRMAWMSWLATWGGSRKARWRREALENYMDELQLQISRGPGPIWQKFKTTLPGWEEYRQRVDPGYQGS